MTPKQIEALAPAFTDYLEQFLFCCGYTQTFELLGVYCRGLLSDLKRKTCEPLALYAGVAVRTLQEFLKDHVWSYAEARDVLQQHVAATLAEQPDDDLGTLGLIDETSIVKKGTGTPGVQRQRCGEVGKQENCIVTVHLGVARGRYKTLVDADLFLPESWSEDRPRCRACGIPDDLVHRPKWRMALEQVDRARANGVVLDWLTFDEDYGKAPEFLKELDDRHVHYAGEVPKSFHCSLGRLGPGRRASRADDLVRHSPAFVRQRGRRFRLHHQTTGDSAWEVKAAQVWVSGGGPRTYWLIWARNLATGEEKYFVSNAPAGASLGRLLRVAFGRWNVEHCFRASKGEVGFRDFQGRHYVALMRHLTLCLVTLTFAAGQAERLRGGKSGGHAGAGVPGVEPTMRGLAGGAAGDQSLAAGVGQHHLSPAA
jgi:SRSO17 transposase